MRVARSLGRDDKPTANVGSFGGHVPLFAVTVGFRPVGWLVLFPVQHKYQTHHVRFGSEIIARAMLATTPAAKAQKTTPPAFGV
jgi:hypothetical protein